MTATGTGPHAALAAPPATPPTGEQPAVEEAERRRQLLLALTTEHFTLQTARSATIADSNGRSALYLATVSSAVVALAFIGQLAHTGPAFFLFALALLPALVLLGILTYLRLVQTATEDLFYARAINRIRRHYLALDPEAGHWFVLCSFDDPAGVLAAMAWPTRGRRIRAGTCCRMPPAWSRWSPASSPGWGSRSPPTPLAPASSQWPPALLSASWSRWPPPPPLGGIRYAAGGPPRTASPASSPPSRSHTPARPGVDHQHRRPAPTAPRDATGRPTAVG
jgi:hypothetical protein